uniref:Uncharacterized protein n=1 Tax=Sciurus vulgaris TaxID=55149 RepID=A0A8D2AIM3_SCIVU
FGGLWMAVTGSATMLTQPQNIHLICFAAYSGPSCTPQPHYWCSFMAGQAQQQLRGQQRGRPHLLNEVHNCSEECFEMNTGSQTPWGGGLISGGKGWDLGVTFRRELHMSSSSLHWEEFKNLPGFLNWFTLSFRFILPEILLSHFFFFFFLLSEAQAVHLGAGRNMCLVNLLENNHRLPPFITV